MQKLLRFLIVSTLTTSGGISAVACGKEAVKEPDKKVKQDNNDKEEIKKVKISAQILGNLGLIDVKGNGLKEAKISWDGNRPYFDIDVDQDNINLSDLLLEAENGVAKAKDQASFDFLRALNIKLQEGATFEDGLFEVADVARIKAKINDVQVETMKFVKAKEDGLYVKKGTYKLQFFINGLAVSENQQLEVKYAMTNLLDGVFSKDGLINLGYDDFIYEGSELEKFRVGERTTEVRELMNKKLDTFVLPDNNSPNVEKLNQLQKLIDWKATFKINYVFINYGMYLRTGESNLELQFNLIRNDETIKFDNIKFSLK